VSEEDCDHTIKQWYFTPSDISDGVCTKEEFDDQEVVCMMCGVILNSK